MLWPSAYPPLVWEPANTMKQDWLNSKIGINIVGIGIAATMLSLAVFTVEDVSILFTGNLVAFRTPRLAFYSLAAVVAALFCGLAVFIFRPGALRIVMSLLAASMASHATEHLVTTPSMPLKVIAAFRIVVSLLVIIPVLRFRALPDGDKS